MLKYFSFSVKVVWDTCRYKCGLKYTLLSEYFQRFQKFSNFTSFDSENVLKCFGKIETIKAPARFELMTCSMPLQN